MTKTRAGAAGRAGASGADPAGTGDPAAALHTVTAGIRSGTSPLQFMDSIDTGGRQLGNRAFMRWVGQMHTGTPAGATHGIAAQGLQGPGRPLAHHDTLQQAFGHHDMRGMREHTGAVAPLQMSTGRNRRNHVTGQENPDWDDMPDLEQEAGEQADPAGQPDVQMPTGVNLEVEQFQAAAENLAEEIPPAAQTIFEGLQPGPELPDMGDEEFESLSAATTDAAAETTGDEAGADIPEWPSYFFPVAAYLYNSLADRAGQIRTEEHGALSQPGILNILATAMLGLLMVGAGLPLDVLGNILGGVARYIMLLCTITGKPVEWLLKALLAFNPPSEEDRARVTSTGLPQGPPGGMDWKVYTPELIVAGGASAYFHAATAQGSLSPSQWRQPWSTDRMAAIIIRVILDNIIYLLNLTLSPSIAIHLLMGRLGWSMPRTGLYLSMLNSIYAVALDYLAAYLTNPQLAIYLTWQYIHEGEELSPRATTNAFMQYAALGMLIQILARMLVATHVVQAVNQENLIPWRRQFSAIRNRLARAIVIVLAATRNQVINVMYTSTILSLVATNIIGPLSIRFGSGGVCVWPAAAAGACGGLPADFDFADYVRRIEAGRESLPPGHLGAIQEFPWLVCVLGLGIPIGYVLAALRRGQIDGHGAAMPVRRGRRTASPDRDRLVEEDGESDSTCDVDEDTEPYNFIDIFDVYDEAELTSSSDNDADTESDSSSEDEDAESDHVSEPVLPRPGTLRRRRAETRRANSHPSPPHAPATTSVQEPQASVGAQPGASVTPMNPNAQELLEMLLTMPALSSPMMQGILDQHVTEASITREEAEVIARLVREEVVLGK